MVVVILAIGLVVGLVIAGILAYGLVGQLRRFRAALNLARTDIEPRVRLIVPEATGRHSA